MTKPSLPPATCRLFIALWPDPALQCSLHRWGDTWRWPPGARRVPQQRLHLTLHFLGAVAADRCDALKSALELPLVPFELSLARSAVWSGGVAVVEPDESPAGLLACHRDLGEALRRLQLRVEDRSFRPHITLARRARGAIAPGTDPALSWPVRGYSLMRSLPGPSGGYLSLMHYGPATAPAGPHERARSVSR